MTEAAVPKPTGRNITARRVLNAGSTILLVLTIASFFGQYSQLCEICSHFVFFLTIGQALFLVVTWISRVGAIPIIATIGLCLNIPKLTPLYNHSDLPVPPSAERVRIMSFNCEGQKNKHYEDIHNIAKVQKADIVCFSEITEDWADSIKISFSEYPHQNLFPRYGGIGIVSKLPIASSEVRLSTFRNRPRLLATVKRKDGTELTILTVRPNIPLNKDAFDGRNLDYQLYVDDLASIRKAKVLIGDLNCTPWSYYYSKLCNESGLAGCTNGKGPVNTWSPAGLLVPMLPIDQCLLSPDLLSTEFQSQKSAGSDHRPIFVEIVKSHYDFSDKTAD